MTIMKIIYKIFLLLFLSSVLLGGEKIAYIQSIKGDVRIYSKNKFKPPVVAIIGREIQENDIIYTSPISEIFPPALNNAKSTFEKSKSSRGFTSIV